MLRLLLAMALALAGASVPCVANDTSASIDAGGLVFTKSTSIQIKSEVLYISPWRIKVDYVFANPTAVDVTTVVAFPLPDLDLARMWFSPSSIPLLGHKNFVDFKTRVDREEIHMNSDIHVILRDGREITEEIKKLDINIFTYKDDYYSPEVRSALRNLGAIDDGKNDIIPIWTTKISFYWTQTFPAGKEIHIQHTYRPGPFKSFVTEQEAEWCTDDAYRAAFKKLPGKMADQYLDGEAVRYVLKTGANWAGPIGDFTLKLDKKGIALLSTCPIPGLSLKREGNMFVAHAQNYTPSADLNILFVNAPRLKTE